MYMFGLKAHGTHIMFHSIRLVFIVLGMYTLGISWPFSAIIKPEMMEGKLTWLLVPTAAAEKSEELRNINSKTRMLMVL